MTDGATQKGWLYVHQAISGFQFGMAQPQDAGTTSKADNTPQWIVTYDFGVAKVGLAVVSSHQW